MLIMVYFLSFFLTIFKLHKNKYIKIIFNKINF